LLIISDKNLPLFPASGAQGSFDPFFHESTAREHGYVLIAGVDEAGRGPLAGPVVAAAVIIPEDVKLPGVKDSKKMTEKARDKAFSLIRDKAISIGIGVISHRAIDESNILKASLEAMRQALLSLEPAPDFVLVDGIHKVGIKIPQKCIKRGDQLSHSISAASVVAKVYRDRIMSSYHEMFPEYGFHEHKGYGTARHLAALKQYGPCPIHRLTFKGVR
jgi:ribonuclease HII